MVNVFENIGLKRGTPCMTPQQVSEIGTILPDQDRIDVLEFGAGSTTLKLFNALKKKYKTVNYVTYETDKKYAPKHKEITVRMHAERDLIEQKIVIPESEKYDLVIVDGPNGEIRQYWYNLFTHNVKSGTIIHIDDAFHFASFEEEFKNCFKNVEYVFERGRDANVNKCWITARVK